MSSSNSNIVGVSASSQATYRPSQLAAGYRDLIEGAAKYELWMYLGWRDTKKHYSRSILGPLWVTLSMGVLVGGLGVLYSQIFKMEISAYLPFLAIGFIMWSLIGNTITAACYVYTNAAGPIRQLKLPYSIYLYQFMCTQIITFLHNFVIFIVVAILFLDWPSLTILLFIPAVILISINGFWIAMILGPLCARFRDIPMIVASVIQVAFFMTPILWSQEQIPDRAMFVNINPFFHFIEIARDPLLGGTGSYANWLVAIGITFALGLVAFLFFARYRSRIAYWA